jgi:hypothetical protein
MENICSSPATAAVLARPGRDPARGGSPGTVAFARDRSGKVC